MDSFQESQITASQGSTGFRAGSTQFSTEGTSESDLREDWWTPEGSLTSGTERGGQEPRRRTAKKTGRYRAPGSPGPVGTAASSSSEPCPPARVPSSARWTCSYTPRPPATRRPPARLRPPHPAAHAPSGFCSGVTSSPKPPHTLLGPALSTCWQFPEHTRLLLPEPLRPRLPTRECSPPDPWHSRGLSSFRAELQKGLPGPPLTLSPGSPLQRLIYFCHRFIVGCKYLLLDYLTVCQSYRNSAP